MDLKTIITRTLLKLTRAQVEALGPAIELLEETQQALLADETAKIDRLVTEFLATMSTVFPTVSLFNQKRDN